MNTWVSKLKIIFDRLDTRITELNRERRADGMLGATYEPLFSLMNLTVLALDPESALVSKAVKAPEKNKVLIREALASGKFSGLVERVLKAGGKLEKFL